MISQQKKIQHLFLRAGFGLRPEETDQLISKSIDELVDTLISNSERIDNLNYLDPPATNSKGEVSNGNILLMILKADAELKQLNMSWMIRMTYTRAVLREKMTLFWHNHFACTSSFSYLMQVQNNMIRKNALGSFKDLLRGISKDPAMILYLNNQQNHKDHPNENFAREVMELFTLGIGQYTEKDIKEAARAFTGWTVNKAGEFEFHEKDHDNGEKEIFGATGNWNGNDVLEFLLNNKQTAVHITRKIYAEFVNETVNEEVVQLLADVFYNSDYDITKLMTSIFKSEWFYDEKNIGVKICSPVEFIVRLKRLINLLFDDYKQQSAYQKVLGQILFFPPNVAGWKGGRNWIDSSSLLYRLNFAKAIADKSSFSVQPKPEFEEAGSSSQNIKLSARWKPLINYFLNNHSKDSLDAMIESYIQSSDIKSDFKKSSDTLIANNQKQIILNQLLAIFSSPEFQLI